MGNSLKKQLVNVPAPLCWFFEVVGETSEVVQAGLALESSHLRVAGFTGMSHCLAFSSDIFY